MEVAAQTQIAMSGDLQSPFSPCACAAPGALDCARRRYGVEPDLFGTPGDENPCECPCHDGSGANPARACPVGPQGEESF